jgi:hypothetical protein
VTGLKIDVLKEQISNFSPVFELHVFKECLRPEMLVLISHFNIISLIPVKNFCLSSVAHTASFVI